MHVAHLFQARHGIKRGSDELLSHSLVTNGTGMSPTQNDINNDAKKVKLEQHQAGKASRVLHFRGVPVDATEGEIVQLGLPFGRMTNLVLAKKKNQAWLEMCDVNSATSMVNFFAEHPPQIRSRTVYVQFSNYEELKTESSQQNAPAAVALQAANQIMSQNMVEDAKTVLRVIVEHMLYPVTIDVLRQIFSRFGQVLKIVTFNKNNTFQALIQYSDAISAQTAKVSLNGQNIYNGCCTLRIDFSKLPSLNVKYNNDKSRDYTNPNLPTGENAMGLEHALTFGAGMSKSDHVKFPNNFEDPSMRKMQQAQARMPLGRSGMDNLKRGGHPGLMAQQFAAPAAMPSFGPHALTHAQITTGGMPLPPEYDTLGSMYFPAGLQVGALQEAQHLPLAAAAAHMPFGYSALQQQAQAIGAAGLRFQASPQTGTVLLVSNMNEEKVTPDALFTLFGVYGDVYRVKIMFNKKDNALVQFADPNQAQIALAHLDKVKVWGKQLKVNHSKHSVVQMPKEGQPDAGLTKDYTTSPLHRFKKPNSKNHHNIFPPSATLHLSNIPPNVTEEQLKEAFSEHGKIVAFKFFQKDRKMALIQMETVEEAVEALIALHNFELGESHHLRVSFTKSTI